MITAGKREAEAALAEAIPALLDAEAALNSIKRDDITEIRSFAKPHVLVQQARRTCSVQLHGDCLHCGKAATCTANHIDARGCSDGHVRPVITQTCAHDTPAWQETSASASRSAAPADSSGTHCRVSRYQVVHMWKGLACRASARRWVLHGAAGVRVRRHPAQPEGRQLGGREADDG